MILFKRPKHHKSKAAWLAEFLFLSVLSAGLYSMMWVAVQSPRLHTEAFHARALHHLDPLSNPSPWVWIRKAWFAWCASTILVFLGSMIVGGLATPVLRTRPHWLPYVGLLIVLPVLVVLSDAVRLVFLTVQIPRLVRSLKGLLGLKSQCETLN